MIPMRVLEVEDKSAAWAVFVTALARSGRGKGAEVDLHYESVSPVLRTSPTLLLIVRSMISLCQLLYSCHDCGATHFS
jgi:hypothetical protein